MAVPKKNKNWDWDGPLKNRMGKLLETGLWSDLVVIFGNKEEVRNLLISICNTYLILSFIWEYSYFLSLSYVSAH